MSKISKLIAMMFISAMIIVIINCSDKSTNPNEINVNINYENIHVDSYEIRIVDYAELPYNMMPLADLENTPHPKDADGIQIFKYKDKFYYHPTLLTMQMSWYVDSFIQSGDSIYFYTILKYYDKLQEIIEEDESSIWIGYPFNYNIHGSPNDIMIAPWYSAMAQGTLLKILSQLYSLTEEEKYFTQAMKVFNTFNTLRGIDSRWVSQIDENNYLWFEEYPDNLSPNNTLNGFLYALFGIYEYYTISGSKNAEFLLRAGITTVKEYLSEFRCEGNLSYYCLKHKEQSRYYHILHIKQIRALYFYTWDSFFNDMADLLYYDHQ